MEFHNLSLTALETTVLESLINNLYAEPGFSDVDAHDIARETGIPTKTIRGVLSSLVKKEIIHLDETDTYGAPEQFVIIYLSQDYWYLHPEWKSEYYWNLEHKLTIAYNENQTAENWNALQEIRDKMKSELPEESHLKD